MRGLRQCIPYGKKLSGQPFGGLSTYSGEGARFRYAVPCLLLRKPSAAGRGGKEKSSHQSAVFGKAGNGTVVGTFELVEAGGVEPPSESIFMGTSPGADSPLHSLT